MNTPTQGITPATTELTVKNTNNERSTLETKEHPSSSHATLTTTDAVKTTQQFTDAREAREIPQDGPSPSPTVDYGYTPAKLKPVDFGKDESTNPEPDSGAITCMALQMFVVRDYLIFHKLCSLIRSLVWQRHLFIISAYRWESCAIFNCRRGREKTGTSIT